MRWGAIGSVGAAGLVVAGLAGCADASAPPAPTQDADYLRLVDTITRRAEESGASSEQLALLARARVEGAASYDLEREALTAFFGCLTDAGIGYEDLTESAGREYPRVDYRVFTSDAATMDTCFTVHAESLTTLYSLQPAVVEEVESLVEGHADAIVACLRDAGYSLPDDPSYDELRTAAYFAAEGTYPDDPGAIPPPGFSAVDCYGAVGLDPRDIRVHRRATR